MKYEIRNRDNIEGLAPRTKTAALKLFEYAKKNNYNVLIYETLRSLEKQKQNVRNGSSQTLKSYHLVGQALDFVFIDAKGKERWNGYNDKDVQDFVRYAKTLGFTWGGDWSSFIDCPHLQYTYKGYGTDTIKVQTSAPGIIISKTSKYTSLVDYLKANGKNATFAGRQKLAKEYGIKDYKGTASQNITLLNKLQA